MDNEKILLLGILLIGGGGAAYYFWNKSQKTNSTTNTTTNNTTKSNTTNMASARNEDTDLADYIPTSFVPFSFSKPSTSTTTVPKQADKQAENQQIVAAMQDKPVFSSDLTSVKITNVPVTSTITKPTMLVFAPKTTPPKVDVNNSGNSEEGCEWRGDCW